jgi:hypothetical protein
MIISTRAGSVGSLPVRFCGSLNTMRSSNTCFDFNDDDDEVIGSEVGVVEKSYKMKLSSSMCPIPVSHSSKRPS